MVNSFFALPCLLLLMTCAGSKSEYCEPNLPMNMTPMNSEEFSRFFLRLQEVSSSTLWFSKRGPNGLRHPRRGRLQALPQNEIFCVDIPSIFTILYMPHLTLHRGTYIESMWNSAGPEFQKLKLRSTVAQFVNAILQKHCLQYHLLRFCLRCRLLGALKSPLSWHDQVESLLTLEHPRGSCAIHRRSCNLDGKHLKKLRSKGRPSDCVRAQTISKHVWIRKSMDKTTTTTCRKQSGKDQAFARYTGNAEDRTSLAQLAQLSHNRRQSICQDQSMFVCLRKSSWHDNGINRTETSKLLWVLVGLDIWPIIHPASVMPNHLRAGPPFWRSQTLRFPTGPSPSPPRAAASLRLTSWMSQGCNQHTENVCHPYPRIRIIGPVRTTIQVPGFQAWRSCAAGASSPRRRSWQAVILKCFEHEAWHLFDSDRGGFRTWLSLLRQPLWSNVDLGHNDEKWNPESKGNAWDTPMRRIILFIGHKSNGCTNCLKNCNSKGTILHRGRVECVKSEICK